MVRSVYAVTDWIKIYCCGFLFSCKETREEEEEDVVGKVQRQRQKEE